jgi:hypothetical protein
MHLHYRDQPFMLFRGILAFDSENHTKRITTLCFEGSAQFKSVIAVSFTPQNTEV